MIYEDIGMTIAVVIMLVIAYNAINKYFTYTGEQMRPSNKMSDL